ncbi:ATP-binding protein [Acidiferrobacter sp.]|uniref:ATP-binding protein n=1 Tax=Acidiferrobacter sp. TaxID=1872107 RepID=UPI00261C1509|nr:ATP-binding protein [Acidiferrobacter sp.]
MRLWPDTLAGRTALVIALALVIAQATFLILARLSFSRMRATQIAELVAGEVRIAEAVRTLVPHGQKTMLARTLKAAGVHYGHIRHAHEPLAHGLFPRTLVRELAARGIGARVTYGRHGLVIHAHHAGRRLSLRLPRLPPALPWPRIGFLIVGAALTGAGALLVVRRVNRPLAALARAASAFGRGEILPPLPEDGPAEIRRVSRAFNHMTEDARRYERDRALLLAGVSHDLRTPLARMRLAVELYGGDSPLRVGMIQDIEEMDAILAEFLAYARHGVQEAPVAGDLNTLIHDLVERFRRRAPDIDYRAEPLPRFPYRPVAIGRLVSNLVDNAISHGRPPIAVRLTAAEGYACIVVEDRGPGLSTTRCAELMAARDLHTSDRRGLGLAVARRIAEAHGGTLVLTPRDGGGLHVAVRLPLPADAPLFEGAAGAQPHRP